MIFFTSIFCKKSFWWLLLVGLNLALGQMPFDLPIWSFLSLIVLGILWVKCNPSEYEAVVWGLGLGCGYFGLTFLWIVEPFLVNASKTGWMAPFALIGLVLGNIFFNYKENVGRYIPNKLYEIY